MTTQKVDLPGPRPGAEPADVELATRVWRQIRELVLHQNDRRREASAAVDDLSFSRIKALLRLRTGPSTMRELAGYLVTDRPYATLIVDELERRGLVARTIDARDRRCRLVALTPAGEEAAQLVDGILHEPPPALAALPGSDLAVLDRITATLLAGSAPEHAARSQDARSQDARSQAARSQGVRAQEAVGPRTRSQPAAKQGTRK